MRMEVSARVGDGAVAGEICAAGREFDAALDRPLLTTPKHWLSAATVFAGRAYNATRMARAVFRAIQDIKRGAQWSG